MKRQFLIMALGLVLNLPNHGAAAGGCTVEKFTHNGSLVDAKSCNGKLTLTFTQPRPELVQRGASNGSMMFTGVEQAGGAISGHALTFDAKCGAIAFAVTGSKQGDAIALQGNLPVRDASCQVRSHETYRMVFLPPVSNQAVKAGAASAPAAVAAATPAPAPLPAPVATADVKQQLSPAEMTTAIQQELARLGCNPGPADGDWGRRSRIAMAQFNRQAKLSLDITRPGEAALPVLRSATGKICSSPPPLQRSVKKRRAAPRKVARPSKKNSSAVTGKKKELWGGEQTRVECQLAITADCF